MGNSTNPDNNNANLTPWTELPAEIWLQILTRAYITTDNAYNFLQTMKLVSKQFRELARSQEIQTITMENQLYLPESMQSAALQYAVLNLQIDTKSKNAFERQVHKEVQNPGIPLAKYPSIVELQNSEIYKTNKNQNKIIAIFNKQELIGAIHLGEAMRFEIGSAIVVLKNISALNKQQLQEQLQTRNIPITRQADVLKLRQIAALDYLQNLEFKNPHNYQLLQTRLEQDSSAELKYITKRGNPISQLFTSSSIFQQCMQLLTEKAHAQQKAAPRITRQ